MNIWLDDVRMPEKDPDYIIDPPPVADWIWVKNLAELEVLLMTFEGRIDVMSFDHDLGLGEPTGYDIIKWLQENHLDRYPRRTTVHSWNPIGAKNIRMFDANVRKHLLGGAEMAQS